MTGSSKSSPQVRVDRVTTEGDTLYYEIRGAGPPLLFIPGGGGDGGAFAAVAERLSDEFKVLTYDRRMNGRSTMNFPDQFDVHQESRDAVAVLRAADESSAFVVGNSSGAVVALDMATSHPEAVAALIAHEPPLARVHPDCAKWQAFFQSVLRLHRRFGRTVAMLKFTFGIGVGFDFNLAGAVRALPAARRAQRMSPVPYLDRRKVIDHFLEREMLTITEYKPNIEALRKMSGTITMAAGRTSLAHRRFYAETAPVLAERIGCAMAVFPGHHASFADRPDEWAAELRKTLHRWR